MKKVTIALYILLMGAGTLLILVSLSYNSAKETTEKEYYDKTEALLDSISNWDESFMDTVMETDAYYEYELAKENLK